jgi:hypothetical protein
MTRVDTSGPRPSSETKSQSGPAGPTPEAAEAAAAAVFADLGRGPTGMLESVERLQILESLSYGVLYEGRIFQASRAEEVWLLELDAAFERDPNVFARVLVELLAASRLRDSSLLSPRGVFRHGESIYVLLDACAGMSLATAFEFLGRSGLRFSSEAVLRIASSALTALDSIARRESTPEDPAACHGLLTPENVFLANGQRVLVRGFGLWPAGIHRLGLLGPNEQRYLAPSQNRSGTASPRTDLLALGTILFEAVTGFPAFDAPAQEEDLSELRSSVAQLQGKAEPSLWDLFEIVLSCLSPPSAVTPAYRARVRKTIDTLFLREFSRDRVAKTLSLEDLVDRVKPRRAAIVKATPISLAPAEIESDDSEPPRAAIPSGPAEVDDASTVSVQDSPFVAEPPEPAPPPAGPSSPPRTAGSRWQGISSSPWIFAAATIALALLVAVFWSSWPGTERASEQTVSRRERPVIRPAAPPPEALPTSPAPLPAAPVERVAAGAPASRAAERPAAPQVLPRPRGAASAREPARRREAVDRPRKSPAVAAAPAASDSPAPAADRGPAPAVAAGTLVPFGTPGLDPPALIEKPAALRYAETDPRPAFERSALLEILVSDSGRVRGSRIVRADRLPSGFTGGLEKYLAGLRFKPAELGGVPVKVWMPYELRYLAP